MAKITIPLEKPVKFGDITCTNVVLREPTTADIIDAGLAAEQILATPDGYKVLVSPTLMGLEILTRQIESIGDYDGEVQMSDLRKFSREDFETIQYEAELIDQAVLEAVMRRGEDDASGGEPDSTNNAV